MPAKARNGALRAVLSLLLIGASSSQRRSKRRSCCRCGSWVAALPALRIPDYRGSEEVRNYVFPIPWVVYRGEIFRADREGVRARFFDSERVELRVGIGGSVPVDSDRNQPRGRAWRICVRCSRSGQLANVHLWWTDDRLAAARSALPVRAAFTFQNGVRNVGYVFAPQLNLDLRWPSASAADRWNFGLPGRGAVFRPAPERILLRRARRQCDRDTPRISRTGGLWRLAGAGGAVAPDGIAGGSAASSSTTTSAARCLRTRHSLHSGGKSAAALRSAMCLPNRPLWCRRRDGP